VESVNLWVLEIWKTVDIFNINFIISMFWSIVFSRWREFVVIIVENLLIIEIRKDTRHQSSIFVISYSSSIVTFTGKVIDSIKRYFVWIFIDKQLQLESTDSQIGLIELILNVPSKRSIEFSLLNICMEEA